MDKSLKLTEKRVLLSACHFEANAALIRDNSDMNQCCHFSLHLRGDREKTNEPKSLILWEGGKFKVVSI